jgi:hypothetical protein
MSFTHLNKPSNQAKKARKTEGRWDSFVETESPFSLGRTRAVSVKIVGFSSTEEDK